jgi:hypothetical protein
MRDGRNYVTRYFVTQIFSKDCSCSKMKVMTRCRDVYKILVQKLSGREEEYFKVK